MESNVLFPNPTDNSESEKKRIMYNPNISIGRIDPLFFDFFQYKTEVEMT